MCFRRRKLTVSLLSAGSIALLVAATSPATPASKTNPPAGPAQQQPPAASPRPLLDQLNRESQALYGEVQGSLVRVQLPTPRWMNDATAEGSPLSKYGNLDPEFRRHLEAQPQPVRPFGPGAAPPDDRGGETPTTRPSPSPEGEPRLNARGRVIVIPPLIFADPQRDALLGGRLQMELSADQAAGTFAPNSVALRLDDAGHVLVPLYLEPETCAAHPVRCAAPQGRTVEAKFVGSDRQTNLTVLRITPPADAPATRPTLTVHFREAEQVNDRPAGGSLLLYVSPADGSGRLGVWNGAAQEFGLVYQTDGAFAGIVRYGQFLSGRACRLIADQLIEHGSVRRATLGVVVSELRLDDPLRRQLPVLGTHTAMRVERVVPGSAAEKAGLLRGDLLLTLAGEAVSDIPSLAASIAARSGRTELQILRDGQVREVVVDLEPK